MVARLAHHGLPARMVTIASIDDQACFSVTVYVAAQALARVTYADLSRWGGAIFEAVFNAFSTEIPTETDPSVVDYTGNETPDPLSVAVSRSP